jgi:hypothetical protein
VLALFLLSHRQWRRALVAIDAVIHQRMAGIEQQLDFLITMALLALGDVGAGKDQIVDDGIGAGPGAKQVIALEEAVVPITGVRNHQRLHRQRVLLHQVRDAGVGIDHDLVGKPHLPAPIGLLGGDELFTKGPMVVVDRQTDRRIGVDHLLRGDDLDLVRVGIEPELLVCDAPDLLVEALQQWKAPFGGVGDEVSV